MVTKVADMTVDEFSESIAKAIGGKSGSSPTPSAAPSGMNFGFIAGLDKAIAEGITGVSKLGSSSSATASAVGLVGAALGKLPIGANSAVAAFGAVDKVVSGSVDSYQKQLNAGTAFTGGLLDMEKTRARSGLSQEQFAKQQEDMAKNLISVSGQSGEAMKKLTSFQDEFKKTDVAKQLQSTFGLSSEQLATYTNTWITQNGNIDLNDKKAKDAALKSLEKMTENTIQQSQATGQSTDVINKQNRAMNESLQMQLMRLEGDEKQNEALSDLMPQLVGLGPALQNLALEASSDMGVTGDKAVMTQGALGSQGVEFSDAVRNLKAVSERGGSPEEKKEAEMRLEAAKIEVNTLMRSKEFTQMAEVERRGGQTGTNGAMLELMKERLPNLQNDKAKSIDLQRQNMSGDPQQVAAYGKEQTNRAIAGVDANGNRRAGDEALAAGNQANTRIRDEMINAEVKAIGGVIKGLDNFAKKLNEVTGKVGGGRYTAGEIAGNPATGQKPLGQQQTENTPRVPGLYPPKRHTGTEGEINSRFEPKDAILSISKGENVLDPSKAKKYDAIGGEAGLDKMMAGLKPPAIDLKSMDPSKMFGDMQKQMNPMMENMQKQMTPMMENMQKQMTPMMSDMQKQMSSTFSNMKMPSGFDDKKLTSMIGNIKQPDPGQLANMAKSMIPPADNSAASASRDMISNLKNATSSMAQSSKPPESAAPTSVTTEEPTNIAPPVATDSFNSDVLNALNNLNKLTAQSLDALVRTAGHAEKTAGGIDGLSGNRFG
jgi:hypothetical protein